MTAVIFDMDDTLVATAALWQKAESRLLESLDARRTEALARQYKGMNALDVAATIHRAIMPAVSVEECQRRMRGWLLEAFRNTPPAAMDGAAECVARFAARTRVALASGSPMEAIELATKRLGIWEHLSVVLSSEEVRRGKPAPDVFLAAAERLGVKAAHCVVIEDSLIGVEAALAAGMACFAVPSGAADVAQAIRERGARIFRSLRDIQWNDIPSR